MREIKFRTWSNKAKKYFYGYCAHECLTQQIVFDSKETCVGLGYDHISDGMVFEQFTGLKDKNGKEIYDGDIVKRWAGRSGVWVNEVIEFAKGAFLVASPCEIIGNIHKNPELLND